MSPRSLETARANFDHNQNLPTVRRCHLETTVGDAFTVMAALASTGERYDVVVVDPPSFAHTQAAVPGALRAYRRLTDLAVRLVDDGGLLVQASCSSRVGIEEFFAEVPAAAAAAGRRLDGIRRTGHPLDHPIGFPEGGYLKAIVARVLRVPSTR
jgi:23S rRNA (cytosine1962-C5)-methyltransferase